MTRVLLLPWASSLPPCFPLSLDEPKAQPDRSAGEELSTQEQLPVSAASLQRFVRNERALRIRASFQTKRASSPLPPLLSLSLFRIRDLISAGRTGDAMLAQSEMLATILGLLSVGNAPAGGAELLQSQEQVSSSLLPHRPRSREHLL